MREAFATTRDIAQMLRVHPKTVERLRKLHGLPFVRIGGSIRYIPERVASWASAQEGWLAEASEGDVPARTVVLRPSRELTRVQASEVDQGMLVVHRTKSGRLRRVPLTAETAAEIRGRVGRLVRYSWKSPGSFAGAIRRLSGVRGFHVHQLRHTFACRQLERGGSLAALQQVIGHTSLVTTQRYARLSDEAIRQEAARLANAGGSA